MNESSNDAAPASMVAGALAHLARHMTSGCLRSARSAAMLLERVAHDPEVDVHLREHALELVEILERDSSRAQTGVLQMAPRIQPLTTATGRAIL